MPGLLGRADQTLVCTSTTNYRFVFLVHIMIVVAPLLVPCGSLCGGYLGYQHDAHILSSRDAARSVPRHAPHFAPRDFRCDAYFIIARGIARGVCPGGPRDHPRVDSLNKFRDFLVDCQEHLRVQNEMTSQYLLHIKPRTLQIRNEHEKVI